MGDDLKHTEEKRGEMEVLHSCQNDKGKGVRKETIYFYF